MNLDIKQKKTNLTVLHYAAAKIKAQEQINEFFEVAGKEIDLNIQDKNGNTALHYAAYCRNVEFVRMLLDTERFDVNEGNKFGFTPLHMSLFSYNESKDHTPALEKLLMTKDININQIDKDERTPLFYLFFKHKKAAENQVRVDPVNVLMAILNNSSLNEKVNLNHIDKNGNLILHYASRQGSTICALTLMNNGS